MTSTAAETRIDALVNELEATDIPDFVTAAEHLALALTVADEDGDTAPYGHTSRTAFEQVRYCETQIPATVRQWRADYELVGKIFELAALLHRTGTKLSF